MELSALPDHSRGHAEDWFGRVRAVPIGWPVAVITAATALPGGSFLAATPWRGMVTTTPRGRHPHGLCIFCAAIAPPARSEAKNSHDSVGPRHGGVISWGRAAASQTAKSLGICRSRRRNDPRGAKRCPAARSRAPAVLVTTFSRAVQCGAARPSRRASPRSNDSTGLRTISREVVDFAFHRVLRRSTTRGA